MEHERFDLVVIGSGPAGEKGATVAAYHGKRVAMVERLPVVGGTVVRTGGVPTKALRATALRLRPGSTGDGITVELDREALFQHLRARAGAVSAQVAESVSENLDHRGIELIRGHARLTGDGGVEVSAGGRPTRLLVADVILLATGSHPVRPPSIPFDGRLVLDSDEILAMDRPFGSIVIVGAGAVGSEYASILSAIGISVCLVDAGSRFLPLVDAEVAAVLATAMENAGVHFRLASAVERVTADGQTVCVELSDGTALVAERLLFAAGRTADIDGLGLDGAGVEVSAARHVVVDHHYRTTAPGVYAAGDVIGPPALASTSMEQARVAMNHAFGLPLRKEVDELLPIGIYTIPEVASVGLTEEQASDAGLDYETGRAWFARNTKAIVAGDTEGLVKLVFERAGGRLLGVHIVGAEAAELVHHGQAIIHHGGGIGELVQTTFNVPTRSDAYKYAAYDGLKRVEARSAFEADRGTLDRLTSREV